MYIAYSVMQCPSSGAAHFTEADENQTLITNQQLRYRAYQDICHKYRHEIAAIQKYLPGWQPAPPSL